MALIPTANAGGLQLEVVSPADQPTKTYRIDFEKNRIIGYVDRQDAMKQAIYKVIMTDRFKHLIYSWNYGTEWEAVQGKSWGVVESELKRIINEALLADSRILEIRNFEVSRISSRVFAASFTAETIFGDVEIKEEVEVDV